MANLKFTNFAVSTIADVGGIAGGDLAVNVAAGEGALFPSLAAGEYFYCVLVDSSANREIVKVTARTTDAFTIVRAQDGTSARAFSQGDKIELRLTAVQLESFQDTDEIWDADADTGIQVEESADEDVIRFDVAGSQVATMDSDGLTADEVDAAELKIAGTKVDASADEIDAGCDGIGVTIPRQKIVEIGDWNMDSTSFVQVAHGFADHTKIVGIRGLIRDDGPSQLRPLNNGEMVTGVAAAHIQYVESSIVQIVREAGGHYDSTSYNSTSYNRGWLIFDYID